MICISQLVSPQYISHRPHPQQKRPCLRQSVRLKFIISTEIPIFRQCFNVEFKYILNKVEAIVQPCRKPEDIENSSYNFTPRLILLVILVYSFQILYPFQSITPFSDTAGHSLQRGTLSQAFSSYIKIMCVPKFRAILSS